MTQIWDEEDALRAVAGRPDYKPAVRAHTASHRLHVVATMFIVLISIGGAGGALAGIGLLAVHTNASIWVGVIVLGATAFWVVSGLLIGMAVQTYARDVQARAPWNQNR